MNNRWNRFLSLLLVLCTVLTMIPAAFALETTEELPQDPGTGEEEVVAVEDIDADAGIMPAATFVPDGSSDTEYPAITVTGTSHGSKAAELLDLLNQARAENASTILIRSATATEVASAMAAEYIYGSDIIRATGEDWSTLAGDKELEINEGTSPLLAFVVTDEADAELAMECFASSYTEILDSTAFNNAGIGCFELKDGSVYWAMLLYSGTEYKDSVAPGDSSASYDVPFDAESICAYMDFDLDDYDLNMGESFTLNVIMDNGYDKIVIPASELTYTSSDEKVITIAKDGMLSAVGTGKAKVTATLIAEDSFTVTAELTSALNLIKPEIKSVTNASNGVQISWTEVPGATHFKIYRSTKSGSWGGCWLKNVTADQTSYVDKTAVAGKSYYYTVRAAYFIDGKEQTAYSSAYNQAGVGICYLPMPAPSSAKASDDGITFSWKTVTGAAGYAIYRKVNGKGSWAWIANVGPGVSSYLDTNVTKGAKYSYTVKAYNGSYKSAYSATGVSATASATVQFNSYVVRSDVKYRVGVGTNNAAAGTLKAGTTINVFKGWSRTANNATWFKFSLNGKVYYVMSSYLMGAPALKSVANHASGAQITWNSVANAGGYAIYRKAPGASTWSWIANVKSSATSYIDADKNLTSGSKYSYTVRAYSGSIRSPYNAVGLSLTYIKTPALTSATAGVNSITFKWTPVSGADGYHIYRRENGGAWKWITKVDATVSSYVDTSVTSLVEYGYTVRAYIGEDRSSYVTGFVADILIPAGSMTTVTVTEATKYRTGAGTNYSASGTFPAGRNVKVVAADLADSGKTWCRVYVTSARGNFWRYIPKSSTLQMPKMGKTVIATNGIVVYWNKVDGATAYEVWRHAEGKSWEKQAVVSSTATSYRDTSVSSGTAYYYTVRANKGTVRSWFEEPGASCLFLSVPTLTSASSAKTGITVQWGRVDGAKGYYIYRRSPGSGWTAVGSVSSGTTLKYTDKKNLVEGVTYSYTVRAYSGTYISGYNVNGISATAAANLNLATVKYTVKVTSAPYYKLDASGQVLASGEQSTTLKKGDVIEVLSGMPVVEDTFSPGVTYTPFQKGGAVYYIRTSFIEKA